MIGMDLKLVFLASLGLVTFKILNTLQIKPYMNAFLPKVSFTQISSWMYVMYFIKTKVI